MDQLSVKTRPGRLDEHWNSTLNPYLESRSPLHNWRLPLASTFSFNTASWNVGSWCPPIGIWDASCRSIFFQNPGTIGLNRFTETFSTANSLASCLIQMTSSRFTKGCAAAGSFAVRPVRSHTPAVFLGSVPPANEFRYDSVWTFSNGVC